MREMEIQAWLSENNISVDSIAILDDELQLFDILISRVIEIDGTRGLTRSNINSISELFSIPGR